MGKLSKILSYVLYLLLALTVVFTAMFFAGGDIEGQAYTTPVYTDLMLNWAKFLFFATVVITIVAEIIKVIANPGNAVRSLISIVALVVIALVSYALSDGTPLKLEGYDGGDNIPSMLKLAGTFLYGSYILLGILIVAIVGTELSKIFK